MIYFSQVGIMGFGLKIVRLVIIYNVSYFVYTTFLGNFLGYGIQVKNCGPWAGNLLKQVNNSTTMISFDYGTSGYWSYGRDRKSLCSRGEKLRFKNVK